MKPLEVRAGSAQECLQAARAVPEFHDVDAADFRRRWDKPARLGLVAIADREVVGFKIGYDRDEDGDRWYSWLGGVLPDFRGGDVAQQLMTRQEHWVRAQGYRRIVVKTRNKFVGMRVLLARNGYAVSEVVEGAEKTLAELRLIHEKRLEP